MERESKVTQMVADNHRTFSRATGRDAKGEIVWRQRLDHADRRKLREPLKTWPTGVPVVLEGTFGWGWVSDEPADRFGSQGRRFLTLLVAPKDITLRDSARMTMKGHLQMLDHVRRQIAEATREIRRQIKNDPVGDRLRTIPGIAWILA